MALPEELKAKILTAIQNNQVATPDQLIEDYNLEITLTPKYQAYSNPRVTALIDRQSNAEVGYVRFLPMAEEGLIVIQACTKDAVGATEFSRGESRRTGTFSLRVALRGFDLEWGSKRNLHLPVEVQELTEGGESLSVLIIRVKTPASKKRASRKTKEEKQA